MSQLVVNGETQDVGPELTVKELLARRGHDPRYVAVAVNRTFVAKSAYESHQLRPGDEVEIVAPQAGG